VGALARRRSPSASASTSRRCNGSKLDDGQLLLVTSVVDVPVVQIISRYERLADTCVPLLAGSNLGARADLLPGAGTRGA
jgi:hypothetical protein